MNKRFFLVFGIFLLAFILISFVGAAKIGTESGEIKISKSGNLITLGVPAPYCGDNIKDSFLNEQCDGTDLGGATCDYVGYDSGTVSCKSNCILDFSECYNSAPTINPTITTSSGGGGGGPSSSSTTSSCIVDWNCSDWNECYEEIQTRICVDLNECGTDTLKPSEERECINEGISGDEATMEGYENKGFFRITGNAIADSFTKSGNFVGWFILVIILAGLYFIFFAKKTKGTR